MMFDEHMFQQNSSCIEAAVADPLTKFGPTLNFIILTALEAPQLSHKILSDFIFFKDKDRGEFIKVKQDQVNNANSAIIFLINR